LYIRDLGPGVEFGDTNWIGRQGIALALHSVADVLGSKDLPIIMTFLISRALVSVSVVVYMHHNFYEFKYIKNLVPLTLNLQADPNLDVRGRMINAGILIIDKHGKENVPLLFPIFESYLNKRVSSCDILSIRI
jgi:hypothetical protein